VMRMTAGNTEVRNAADTGEGAQGRSGIGAPASRRSPRTTPLRRSITAISTGAVRGQVPEREARWAEQELLAGFARRANLNDRDTARSSCEPIRRLDAVKRRWSRPGGATSVLPHHVRQRFGHGIAKVTRLRQILDPTTTTRERPRGDRWSFADLLGEYRQPRQGDWTVNIKQVSSEGRHIRVGGRSGRIALAHRAGVSTLVPAGSLEDEKGTPVEGPNPTTMTSDLCVALARVDRTRPAGWTRRSECDA
jgi:hypothetical protein